MRFKTRRKIQFLGERVMMLDLEIQYFNVLLGRFRLDESNRILSGAFAASAAIRVCGQTYPLQPKPPPRNSETTVIFAGGMPSTIDTSSLVPKRC